MVEMFSGVQTLVGEFRHSVAISVSGMGLENPDFENIIQLHPKTTVLSLYKHPMGLEFDLWGLTILFIIKSMME